MDWETYYDKFYDWASSTQISKLSSLTSFGPSCEVAEIAQEFMDEKAASRLIKKAVAYGVQFTPDEICDLSGCCDTSAMNALLDASKCKLDREQLEKLWGAVDDDVLDRVAERNHVTLFEDKEDDEDAEDELEPEPESEEDDFLDEPVEKAPKIGFFTKLATVIAVFSESDKRATHHPRHCTGDCANCPPHYGYRYGRWYYGHGHVHGCEFGGNKGGGGM